MYTTRPAGSTRSSARAGRWAALDASMTASKGGPAGCPPSRRGRSPAPAGSPASSSSDRAGAPRPRRRARTWRPAGRWCPGRGPAPGPRAPGRRPRRSAGRCRPARPGRRAPDRPCPAAGAARRPEPPAARPGRPVVHRERLPPAGSRTRAGVPAGSGGSTPSPSMVSPITRRPTQPGSARPDRGHRAAPLVTGPHREARVALVQVGHLPGEELDVGAAYADPLDRDDRLAREPAPASAPPAPRTHPAR